MRFKNTANCYGVSIEIVSSPQDIADYINTKGVNETARAGDRITNVEIFAHGTAGTILLGHQKNAGANFHINDIKLLNNQAFANATTWFGSCNAGTSYQSGDSFAQAWSDKTKGRSTAVVDGKTNYEFMNVVENMNVWQKLEKLMRGGQRRLINYSADGSYNYPIASAGVEWNDFMPIYESSMSGWFLLTMLVNQLSGGEVCGN